MVAVLKLPLSLEPVRPVGIMLPAHIIPSLQVIYPTPLIPHTKGAQANCAPFGCLFTKDESIIIRRLSLIHLPVLAANANGSAQELPF